MRDVLGGTLQSAATTGNGTAVKLSGRAQTVTFIATFAGTLSAGVITYEVSDDPNYAGVWHSLGTENYVTGGAKKIQTFTGAFPYVRARISTNMVGGGTASVEVRAN